MPRQLTLRITPGMEGLARSHPAAIQATEELYADIRRSPGTLIEERDTERAQPSTKGALQELLLSPESAGAAWAAVKVVKLWLARDRRRTLTVTIDRPGHERQTIHASGDSISVEALERAVHDVVGAEARDGK